MDFGGWLTVRGKKLRESSTQSIGISEVLGCISDSRMFGQQAQMAGFISSTEQTRSGDTLFISQYSRQQKWGQEDIKFQVRSWGFSSVEEEHLACKCQALGSVPSSKQQQGSVACLVYYICSIPKMLTQGLWPEAGGSL